MRPQKKVQATHASKLAPQFFVARSVIFNDDSLVEGTDRPKYTTAGYVREPKYMVPFPLGPFTFMLSEGTKTPLRAEVGGETYKHFGALVWIAMAGPIAGWNVYETPNEEGEDLTKVDKIPKGYIQTPTTEFNNYKPLRAPQLIVNGKWLCIGILRQDEFIYMTPEFMSLLRMLDGPQYPVDDDEVLGRDVQAKRVQVDGVFKNAISCVLETTYPTDMRGSPDRPKMYVYGDIVFQWIQKAPGMKTKIWDPLYFRRGTTSGGRFKKMDEVTPFKKDKETIDLGASNMVILKKVFPHYYKTNPQIKAQCLSDAPVFESHSYLPFDVPDSFMKQLIAGEWDGDTNVLCSYLIPKRGYEYEEEGEETGWKLEDIASVCYAQSLLLHVLTGPDKRRYDPTHPNDESPMKEDSLPACPFTLAVKDAGGAFQLMHKAFDENGVFVDVEQVVSLRSKFTFFRESENTRFVNDVHKKILDATRGPNGQVSTEKMVKLFTQNPEILSTLKMIDRHKKEFEQFEFLGCHVCMHPEKEYAYKVTGSNGIQVCSNECYQNLKAMYRNMP